MMVKVKYNGHVSPCTVSAGNMLFKKWVKGEIRDVSDDIIDMFISNKDFEIIKEKSKKSFKKKVIEEVIDNSDGDSNDVYSDSSDYIKENEKFEVNKK